MRLRQQRLNKIGYYGRTVIRDCHDSDVVEIIHGGALAQTSPGAMIRRPPGIPPGWRPSPGSGLVHPRMRPWARNQWLLVSWRDRQSYGGYPLDGRHPLLKASRWT